MVATKSRKTTDAEASVAEQKAYRARRAAKDRAVTYFFSIAADAYLDTRDADTARMVEPFKTMLDDLLIHLKTALVSGVLAQFRETRGEWEPCAIKACQHIITIKPGKVDGRTSYAHEDAQLVVIRTDNLYDIDPENTAFEASLRLKTVTQD